MSRIHTVASEGAALAAMSEFARPLAPVLLLYDEGLEELHERLVRRFLAIRTKEDHVLVLPGEHMHSMADFYDQCIRVMPECASYFGRNLDALDEVLRDPGLGLATQRSQGTFWVWRSFDQLFVNDTNFASRACHALVENADEVCRGAMSGKEDPTQAQPVVILLTGRWSVLGSHASAGKSFLNWMVCSHYLQAPEWPTNLTTIHLQV